MNPLATPFMFFRNATPLLLLILKLLEMYELEVSFRDKLSFLIPRRMYSLTTRDFPTDVSNSSIVNCFTQQSFPVTTLQASRSARATGDGSRRRWPEQRSGSTAWLQGFAWWWWVAGATGCREKERERRNAPRGRKGGSRILNPN